MASLNEIVTSLASKVGREHEFAFKKELEHIVNYKRAVFIRQSLQKGEVPSEAVQKIDVELIKASENECLNAGCEILKSSLPIPATIRDGSIPIGLVADGLTRNSFKFIYPEEYKHLSQNKFGKSPIYYSFVNGHIYVYGNTKIRFLAIRDIFENPMDLAKFECNGKCYSSDDEYPVPLDILNTIVTDILSKELNFEARVNKDGIQEVNTDLDEPTR